MITIHQRYRQSDRQTTCDRNTALCTKLHSAVIIIIMAIMSVMKRDFIDLWLWMNTMFFTSVNRGLSILYLVCSQSNFLQLGRRSGGRPQRTVYPRRLPVNTVIHTTLACFEPTTFRLLVRVRRATSSDTDSPHLTQCSPSNAAMRSGLAAKPCMQTRICG